MGRDKIFRTWSCPQLRDCPESDLPAEHSMATSVGPQLRPRRRGIGQFDIGNSLLFGLQGIGTGCVTSLSLICLIWETETPSDLHHGIWISVSAWRVPPECPGKGKGD